MCNTWQELADKVEAFVGMKCEPDIKYGPTKYPHRVNLHFKTKTLFKLTTITIFLSSDGWVVGGTRDGAQDHYNELLELSGD